MDRRNLLASLLLTAAVALTAWSAVHAAGLWALDTDVCTSDGTRCIRGINKSGAPFTSQAECERQALALLRQYRAAHMRVGYVRCVPL
jgi:hypothetical protein